MTDRLMKIPGLCLRPGCTAKAAAGCKGLCMKDYSASKKLVSEGKTTWEELAELGLAIVNTKSPMELALHQARKKETGE